MTSTYVEGAAASNPLLRRGYSRDHRPDCQQLVLAVVVNAEGFPLSYEVFNGNRPDVTTMESILRTLERKYGKARRVCVFDRGIVSEENLASIRRRDRQYLVGAPRSKLKEFEAELLQQENWKQVRPEVEVKQVGIPQGEETFILCRTQGRKEKEKAMRSRFATRIEEALAKLQKRVAGRQAEGPRQDPSPTGAHGGSPSPGGRSLRDESGGNRSRITGALAGLAGTAELA